MAEFTIPSFLTEHSAEEVHELMKAVLPDDLDLSEGGHAWNFTFPTALVAAEMCEFILPEVIKLAFPEWSYGEFLDGHAKARGITRRAATAATGEVTVSGEVNTSIPAGSVFSTAAINEEPSVSYETLESVKIPESGSVTVKVQCTETGISGNTTANTVVMVSSRITGVTAVTNAEPITGGTDEEEDESLIERVVEYDKAQGDTFVGSVSDYKRWATSVQGVGEADVIPAQDNSGLVTIILTDANGVAATEELCEAVYNYIMRPDAPDERLAPINAQLSVVPPAAVAIGVKATIELEEGATIESVAAAFRTQLVSYLPLAMADQEVKLTKVSAALSSTVGVNDFSDLQIGAKAGDTIVYGTANIPITTAQLPEIAAEDIIFTAGTV